MIVGMYDLHCHILPGVDDGAKSLDDAIEMARVAFEHGTSVIVATPHRRDVTENSSVRDVEELLGSFADPSKAVPFARICARFFLENFFLEEGQLLRDVGKIKDIPGIIVQGRHDICTPPVSAWELKKAWPEAELWIVHDAGHSAGEPGIIDGLVRATDKLAG